MVEFKTIPLDKLIESEVNLRSDVEIDEAFVSSVKKNQIHEIIVRPLKDSDSFEIVCGRRRFTALREAGAKQATCKASL